MGAFDCDLHNFRNQGFFSTKYCFLKYHLALWEIDWDLKLHPDSEFQIQELPKEDKADPEAAGQ